VETDDAQADQCPQCLGVWLDHETFDRLTHPEEKNAYLTMVFRDALLQFTTGKAKPAPESD
jgi:Zn-finger nucleic acid-binding protein